MAKRHNKNSPITLLLPIFIGAIISFGAFASQQNYAWIPSAEKQLVKWHKSLNKWQESPPSTEVLDSHQLEASRLRDQVNHCIEDYTARQKSIIDRRTALGEKKEQEGSELVKHRADILAQERTVETNLASCRLLQIGLKELQDGYRKVKANLVTDSLKQRKSTLLQDYKVFRENPVWVTSAPPETISYWPSSLVGFLTLILLLPLGRLASIPATDLQLSDTSTATLLLADYRRRAYLFVVLLSLVAFSLASGSQLLSTAFMLIFFVELGKPLISRQLQTDESKHGAGVLLNLYAYLLAVGAFSQLTSMINWLSPEGGNLLFFSYSILLFYANSWFLIRLTSPQEGLFRFARSLLIPALIVLAIGPIAILLGYQALAELLIPGIYGTFIGIILLLRLHQVAHDLFDIFEPDTDSSNAKIRGWLGYKGKDLIPGLWIGRILLSLGLTIVFLYWLLFAWNIPSPGINAITQLFVTGFSMGAITIVPAKLLAGVAAFFLLLTLARWFRNKLSQRWLQRTRITAGAKESIVSLTTYVVVGLALVFSLSVAGVDFQNVAIVAGALSVGIGFGLQNIVNNFVSGLILLFERPVKPGDWIVVGSTEGYVRKISIRYTLIQSFDRADVLVPNSELISNQVTNWMLKDSVGRLIVPVGVAYGTDTQRVKEILLQVANDTESIIKNDPKTPDPKVLFIGFGDSSLNFELRCFLTQVDTRLDVRSHLLFEIDEAFRRENIEIPFPQRVVHLQSPDSQKDGEA